MITVTTPNGRVGSHVLRLLLERGETVRVMSHRPEKLAQSVHESCEVIAGSLDDAETLRRGFDGADSVFWCIPQSSEGNRWEDAHEYHLRFATAAATALRGSVTRVVAVSAGRHGFEDNGIIAAFSAVEDTIDASGVSVRHLRSAFFMENLLGSLPTLAEQRAIFLNSPGDLPLPMVCIPDLGVKAVQYLTDRSWQGQGFVAVHGPAHVSFNEAAAVLSEVLETPLRYVQVPDKVLIENLKRVGLPDGFARAYTNLLTGAALKAYDIEPRTPETTTSTTLTVWATSTLLPAFKALKG